MKKVIFLLVLILIGYIFVRESHLSNKSVVPIVSKTEQEYKSSLGFQITIPSTWSTDPTTSDDPHFTGPTCVMNQDDYSRCPAFEIQSIPYEDPSIVVERNKNVERYHFYEEGSLIADAVVIKTVADSIAEGWHDEYEIIFPGIKKSFLVFTDDADLNIENHILPTFKVLQ